MLLEAVTQIAGLVVNAGVEAQFVDHKIAFVAPARDANHATALDPCHLPDGLPDRAGGA